MLNPKLGDTLLRVSPPVNGQPGFCQRGTVEAVTGEAIDMVVPRRMKFRRSDGMDLGGQGSFLVKPDDCPA